MSTACAALIERIDSFSDACILCIGDIMLDHFVYGDVSRISPEAPIPVLTHRQASYMPGGAGNVARNIVALGATCHLLSVIGEDSAGDQLEAMLAENPRYHAALIRDPSRPTTEKIRFISGQQQLLRCDREETAPVNDAIAEAILEAAAKAAPVCQLMVISDYAKGLLGPTLLQQLISLAKQAKLPIYVDPKSPDLSRYDGADLVKPNQAEFEAMRAYGGLAGVAEAQAAALLCRQHNISTLAVTRGKDGISVYSAKAGPVTYSTTTQAVYDVSGAGDSVMATLAVAGASGAALPEAMRLANLSGGIAVSRPGTATVYRTDLKSAAHFQQTEHGKNKLLPRAIAQSVVESWREEGKIVGFTNGCFDVLHVGHLQSLEEAKSHCDRLIVAINSDHSIKRLKGPDRPFNQEIDRASLLAGLACVDAVVLFTEDTPLALLKQLKPDILMKGADYRLEDVVGHEWVTSYGGRIVLLPMKEGYSTTDTLKKMSS